MVLGCNGGNACPYVIARLDPLPSAISLQLIIVTSVAALRAPEPQEKRQNTCETPSAMGSTPTGESEQKKRKRGETRCTRGEKGTRNKIKKYINIK